MILLVILIPVILGTVIGYITGFILKKQKSSKYSICTLIISILVVSGIGYIFNNLLLPKPALNFMMIGMAFSATFANMISEEKLEEIMKKFNPILGISMIIVILNLGMPLDYHLIMGAGLFTLIYIIYWCKGYKIVRKCKKIFRTNTITAFRSISYIYWNSCFYFNSTRSRMC